MQHPVSSMGHFHDPYPFAFPFDDSPLVDTACARIMSIAQEDELLFLCHDHGQLPEAPEFPPAPAQHWAGEPPMGWASLAFDGASWRPA